MNLHRVLAALAVTLTLAAPLTSHAFPDMVRHGYIHCATCHLSPTGGGTMSEYGRALSQEVLSSAGSEKENQPLWGAVNPPKWLQIGGDERAFYYANGTPAGTTTKLFIMQADAELAAVSEHFNAVVRGGIYYPGNFESRVHYLQWHPDDHWGIRAGRFMRAYGIQFPEHPLATRVDLGFDQGMETYNLEATYASESWEITGSGVFGNFGGPGRNNEKGFVLKYLRQIGDEPISIGASYELVSSPDGGNKKVLGPFATVSFGPKVCWLLDSGVVFYDPDKKGLVTTQKLDWEPTQGLHLFGTHEYSRPDFHVSNTARTDWGLGAQWFPRPHLDFLATYRLENLDALYKDTWTSTVWILGHIYL
ncbi:MAG TPA: hypothetical protein VL588_10645 [Bdellovibrionota bacterium]|jgi:hypothetical protein|nr:hypothetical protein [Bdellovibrionota bacterium]